MLRRLPVLRRLVGVIRRNPRLYHPIRGAYDYLGHVLNPAARRHWRERNALVTACPDNAHIPRVEDAGRMRDGALVMHNGVRVLPGSYHGYPVRRMLQKNRGVHEPQEERVFGRVIEQMQPGSVMIELGAFWGFYSLWFATAVPSAQCVLVEPHPGNLQWGRRNFALNGLGAAFEQGWVGEAEAGQGDQRTVSVDGLLRRHGLERVHLLHADIQGAELKMLDGAAESLGGGRVDYVFISTHGEQLHTRCIERLDGFSYRVLVAHTLAESYAYDGLIVAAGPHVGEPPELEVSRR